MHRLLGALAASTILTACASGGLRSTTGLRCESDGSTRVARYDAPNVTLVTELDEPLARELVAALEQAHQALRASVFKNLPRVPVRVLAVPFDLPGWNWNTTRNVSELAYYTQFSHAVLTDDDVSVMLQLRASDPRANVMKPKGLEVRERLYATYSLAYILTHLAIPSTPPWLGKGLASYFMASRVDGDTVWVGIPNQETLELDRHADLFPVRELLGLTPCQLRDLWRTQGGPRVAAFDYQSFMLVHFLATTRTASFSDYLARLTAGAEPAAAWNAAFPDLALDRPGGLEGLDAALKKYMRLGRYQSMGYPAPAESFVVRRTPLGCAEARTARLALFRGLPSRDPFEHEAAQLLAETPGHPAGLVARAELADPAEVPALAREALAKEPGSARAWSLLAEALPPGPERAEAASRAAALGAGDPVVELRVAEALLEAGDAAGALAAATRVVAAVPWSVRGNAALARAASRLGRCPLAAAALRRAAACLADRCPERPRELNDPVPLHAPPVQALRAAEAEARSCGVR